MSTADPEHKSEFIEKRIREQTGLENCARCGGEHSHLYWKEFDEPVTTGGARNERIILWAMCPTRMAPILVFAWDWEGPSSEEK